MKITAISDLHGNLIDIPPCDVLLIAGDISPLDIQRDSKKFAKWFVTDFSDWIEKLSCDQVIMIPGNHDFWFERVFKTTCVRSIFGGKLIILINDTTKVYDSINNKYFNICGISYCKDCGNWAYMPGNKELPAKYREILTENIDILLTHGATNFGKEGHVLELDTFNSGKLFGDQYLTEAIRELKNKPKYIICGHVHSGDHTLTNVEGMNIANVSILNEEYKPNYEPLTFEI